MSHVLINYYKPKINTDKVEFNLIDIWTRPQCNCLGDMELISFPLLRGGCILVPEPLIKKLRPLYFYNF